MKRFLILAAVLGGLVFAGMPRSAEAHGGWRGGYGRGGYGYRGGWRGGYGRGGYGYYGGGYRPGVFIGTPGFQFGYGTGYGVPYYGGGYGYGCRGW
jgi:hypothetical protein